MANTTNFGWETPDDTDLVKDGAAAIRTLGSAIDTSLVDLKGGTTGQVLAKASNTDMDFTWATDASGIPATILDAKGDLIAATAADTAARLAVGANNTVLTADSTTATGLKWATPSNVFSGVSTYKVTTDQSIANDTETVITFNAEEFDTDGYHDNSTNNSRITIPAGKSGYFLLIGHIRFASNATGNRYVMFLKNGTTVVTRTQRFSACQDNTTLINATVLVNAVATDYFEFRAYQNSGGALNVNEGQAFTRFAAYYLGA